MFESVLTWVTKMRNEHDINPKSVLETGSRDNKYKKGARPCFLDADKFIGIDIRGGPCVDTIMDIYDIPYEFGPGSFDAVLCLHVLEHLPKPWVAVDQISYILKDGGHLFVSMPTYGYPRHNHPGDYWRASHEAVTDILMHDYDILSMEDDGSNVSGHPFINCLGKKRT